MSVAKKAAETLWLTLLTLLMLALGGCGHETASVTRTDSQATRYQNTAWNDFLITLTQLSDQPVQPVPHVVPINPKAAALGRELFFSPQLSRNDTVACATCHIIDQGGDDNRPVSIGIMGRKGEMNSPTVLNSGFNIAQFWDGRAATLEAQITSPVTTPHEMGFDTFQQLVDKLAADRHWHKRFMDAFGEPPTEAGIRFAIAEYERGLITPGSRFDRYLLGDRTALNEQELRGWHLFQSLGCIGCHQGINLGGTLFQKAGIYEQLGDANASRWLGRYRVTGHESDRHVFKVPGLRNVAETAPYFHDGSVPTLEAAVRRMIRAQLGLAPEPDQVADLVAFLRTLSAPVKEVGIEH